MANSWEQMWRWVDLRHQKNGQIALWRGAQHVGNIFARNPDPVDLASRIVSMLNECQMTDKQNEPGRITLLCPSFVEPEPL